MALTVDEIITHLNEHMRDNWPRGGYWRASKSSAEFVDQKSGQVITAMPLNKAALVVGGLEAWKARRG